MFERPGSGDPPSGAGIARNRNHCVRARCESASNFDYRRRPRMGGDRLRQHTREVRRRQTKVQRVIATPPPCLEILNAEVYRFALVDIN